MFLLAVNRLRQHTEAASSPGLAGLQGELKER